MAGSGDHNDESRSPERDAGNRECNGRATSERDEAPFDDRRLLPLLAEKAICHERDTEERSRRRRWNSRLSSPW
jgi:hypothetical protein